jgi:isopentenyldiphosphate isomerase
MTTEKVDILDNNGLPLGYSKKRSLVHRNGDWHKTVHVWIANFHCNVLFQKRSMLKESFPGAWDVSAAGHISAGETSITAAKKELAEELGLECAEQDLHFLCTRKHSAVLSNGLFIDNEFSDIFVIKADVQLRDLRLQESEVMDVQFYPLSILNRLKKNEDNDFVPHKEEYDMLHTFLCSEFFASMPVSLFSHLPYNRQS